MHQSHSQWEGRARAFFARANTHIGTRIPSLYQAVPNIGRTLTRSRLILLHINVTRQLLKT